MHLRVDDHALAGGLRGGGLLSREHRTGSQ